MSGTPLFTFEASTYATDTEPEFELRMRYQGRLLIWSEKIPVDFGGQNDDYPYEPSSPLTPADLTWALNRKGWRISGEWEGDATDPGYLAAQIAPTPFATPQITLAPGTLAVLTILEPINGE